MSCYETGSHPVRPVGLIRVREGDPNLLGRQTSDVPPRDLGLGSLKEFREECVQKIILRRLKFHTYAWDDMLQEGPLLLEGILQARIGLLRVTTFHPIQGGHRVLSSHNLPPQPLCLL